MKRVWWAACAAGVVGLAAGSGRAQIGGAAAAPVGVGPGGPAPGAAAAAANAPPAAAEKAGVFKRFCTTLEECKRKICKTPAGQLLNNMTRPATALTGGIIPPFCPILPSDKDLLQPGVAGAAAAAQKDAAEAKARRDAVRFLGTLDCRYFPDAAVALAAALRTDSSECVRFEAALVLGRGCCCTQKTIDALEASVSGLETDGNPAERSVRVRCAAAVALERCLSCYTPTNFDPPPTPPETGGTEPPVPDKLPEPRTAPETQTKAGKPTLGPGSRMPSKESIERARRTLNEFNEQLATTAPFQSARPGVPVAGRQSLYELITTTADGAGSGTVVASRPVETPMPLPAAFMNSTAQTPTTPQPAPSPTPPLARPTPAPVVNSSPVLLTPPTPTPVQVTKPAAGPVYTPAAHPMPVYTPASNSTPAPAFVPPTKPAPVAAPTPAAYAPTSQPVHPVAAPVSRPAQTVATSAPAARLATPVATPLPPAANPPVAAPDWMPARPVAPIAPPAPVAVPVPASPAAPAAINPATIKTVPPPASSVSVAKPAVIPAAAQATAPPAVQFASRVEPIGDPTDAAGWARLARQAATADGRQAAMRQLARYNAPQNPVVVETLLAGATHDPARDVRVDCLRLMADCQPIANEAYIKVWSLTADPDPVVRQAAADLMLQLRRQP